MKAIVLTEAGGVENLQLNEVDLPAIQDNEVLVQIKAISLNPADVKPKYSDDMLNMFFGPSRPIILGWDIAGKVSAVGKNVTTLVEGDDVFGMVNFPGVGNAYAEFVASPEGHLARLPKNANYVEGAATTLAALTALQILQGRINKGDRVLIQGGSGGVGHFAIQLAKHMGAYVITTSSAKNREFVLSIGADEHIDYRAQAFEEVLSDIDFVLDVFGGEILKKSVTVLKEGGTLFTTLGGDFSDDVKAEATKRNVTLSGMLVQSSGEDMNTLRELMEMGSLKPNIYKTFPFESMAEAHQEVEKGRTVGKVVVVLD